MVRGRNSNSSRSDDKPAGRPSQFEPQILKDLIRSILNDSDILQQTIKDKHLYKETQNTQTDEHLTEETLASKLVSNSDFMECISLKICEHILSNDSFIQMICDSVTMEHGAEVKKLQNEVAKVSKDNEDLKMRSKYLETKVDELDQYGRRSNLEFHGIPKIPNEDTNQIVKNMVKRFNIDLNDRDISTSHRLPAVGDKHPPIIARFCNRDLKNNIYQKRRNLIGVRDFGIEGMTALYVNENLTHRRRNLFAMAYKQKSLLKYQFIWTVNGEIFTRKCTNSEKIRIANEQDINNLK